MGKKRAPDVRADMAEAEAKTGPDSPQLDQTGPDSPEPVVVGAEPAAPLCPFVKFSPACVHRRELKSHPYNPRAIKESARAKLRANLKRVGLLNALVWNRRTGNVVSGHQRLGILDALMRTDDYLIPVDVVDLDEAEERAQLVAFNNTDMQGDWDRDAMEKLIREGNLNLEAAGLEAAEVAEVFGADALAGAGESEKLEALAAALRDSQERYESVKKASATKADADFYRVVVFRDNEAAAWLNALLEDDAGVIFLDGAKLRAAVDRGNGKG